MIVNQDIDALKQNYDKYMQLLRKFFPASRPAIDDLEEILGERLFLAPRDQTPEMGGTPGGLIAFAVATAKHASMFKDVVDQKKLVRVALIHELGKLGGPLDGQDLFVVETSDWHREKLGRNFKYNEDCPKMSFSHRTLFYIARYGFVLEEDEWLALVTAAGFQYDENRFYANEILPLATALQACRTFALKGFSAQ
jgi:hypothetical protein